MKKVMVGVVIGLLLGFSSSAIASDVHAWFTRGYFLNLQSSALRQAYVAGVSDAVSVINYDLSNGYMAPGDVGTVANCLFSNDAATLIASTDQWTWYIRFILARDGNNAIPAAE